MRDWAWILGVSLLLGLGLGAPLTSPEEARYAEMARDMLDSGDWVVARLHGAVSVEKPPLHLWLVAASYRLIGTNVWAARLPSALAGAVCACALFGLGRRLLGTSTARTAALILLLFPGFQLAAHYANLDATLALWTTLGLLLLWLGVRLEERRWFWMGLGGVAVGLGLLTKGPVALLVVLPPALGWQWLYRRRTGLGPWGIFVAAATGVAASWYWRAWLLYPELRRELSPFVQIQQSWSRLDHLEPWWFFLPVLLFGLFPWSLLLPSVLRRVFSHDPATRRSRTSELGAVFLGSLWPLLIFSLAPGKLASYVLPALPFLAIFLAWGVERASAPEVSDGFKTLLERVVPLSTAVAGLLLVGAAWVVPTPMGVPTRFAGWMWMISWLLLAGLAAVGQRRGPALALACCLLLNVQLLTQTLPRLASSRSLIGRAQAAADLLVDDGGVPSVVVLADAEELRFLEPSRAVEVASFGLEERQPLLELLRRRRRVILVTEPGNLAWLTRRRGFDVREIGGRGHIFAVTVRHGGQPPAAKPPAEVSRS